MPIKDRTNKVYGCYKALEYSHSDNNYAVWKCLCLVCGTVQLRKVTYFAKNKQAKSCASCPIHHKWRGHEEISGAYWSRIKGQAKSRGIEFSVTKEYIWGLYLSQEKRCRYTGEHLIFAVKRTETQTASLDRIDSSKGYIEGNVQWVHKNVNKFKGTLTHDEFVGICKRVSERVVNEPRVPEVK